MKKFIVAVLALVMLLAIAVTAGAETKGFTIYNAPCEAIADSELYNHKGASSRSACVPKTYDNNMVQIRHSVVQEDADETNRIAAYDWDNAKTMGANWHPANYQWYPCTSNAITTHRYTAAGRGNTNYESKYGLNTITLTGSIDSYDD